MRIRGEGLTVLEQLGKSYELTVTYEWDRVQNVLPITCPSRRTAQTWVVNVPEGKYMIGMPSHLPIISAGDIKA